MFDSLTHVAGLEVLSLGAVVLRLVRAATDGQDKHHSVAHSQTTGESTRGRDRSLLLLTGWGWKRLTAGYPSPDDDGEDDVEEEEAAEQDHEEEEEARHAAAATRP